VPDAERAPALPAGGGAQRAMRACGERASGAGRKGGDVIDAGRLDNRSYVRAGRGSEPRKLRVADIRPDYRMTLLSVFNVSVEAAF
jgi:hypothetical protein